MKCCSLATASIPMETISSESAWGSYACGRELGSDCRVRADVDPRERAGPIATQVRCDFASGDESMFLNPLLAWTTQ